MFISLMFVFMWDVLDGYMIIYIWCLFSVAMSELMTYGYG